MIFKFTVLSDEVDDFVRIIEIDATATFFDLHNTILDSVHYEKNQITSFFLCSDTWEKEQEVTLMEMESSSEYDSFVMDETKLEDLLEDEKQKLLYVFDMLSERAFFLVLTEIILGKDLKEPICIQSEGKAPIQVEDVMDVVATPVKKAPVSPDDTNFYGDEQFDLEDLDSEGFGDLSFDDNNLFNDSSY